MRFTGTKTAGLDRGGGGAEAGDFENAEVSDGGGWGVGTGLLAPEGAGGRCTVLAPVLSGWSAVSSSGSESPEVSDSSSADDDLWRFRWAPPRLLTFSWP